MNTRDPFQAALAKSLGRAKDNVRQGGRGEGRKPMFAPYKDKQGIPIAFAFPEVPKPGSSLAKIKRAFELSIDGTKSVPAAKKEIWNNQNLSDAGKKVELTKWVATNTAGKWREQWNVLGRERKSLEDRLNKIKLKEPSQEPAAIREREEIRMRLFSMDDKQRNEFIQKYRHSNPNIVAAVTERVPELSGLTPLIHENMVAELLDAQHSAELAEIADIDDAISAAERAIVGGRDEARKQSGINFQEYEKILSEVEKKVDEDFQRQPDKPLSSELPDDEAQAVFDGVSKLSSKQRSNLLDFMADIAFGKKAAA